MAEIQVPVKLLILNLQSLVTELQNKLSNLKVGSTGFKNILNIIQSIRGEIDKLSVLTAKPFVDASLFTKAERSVDKLEDLITKVSIAISRLKFGDLELTDAQKADIKGFEDSINNIKDKIKTVKDAAKEAFLKTEVGLEWLSINPEAATKSLSQITGAIEREVDKLRQELEKLKASAADYLKAIDLNNRVREFLDKSGDNPLSKLNLGELYDKIFLETKKGTRYTPNGRNLLADWLSSQLKLDDSTISLIINKNVTAANVTGKLKEVLSSLLTADKDLHAKQDANNVALQEKLALYNLLAATLNTAAAAQLGITVAEQAARAELANTEAAAASYKDRLVDIARSGANVQSTTNAMKSQLEGFRTTLEQASGSFLRLLRTQLSFNQMKMAVVNFMGFNQVLNLTKRAVREAVNHIKELDTVMNKISIVTDMSTGDLWGQVDQYSKMAQAFGTTIKGAYEVSQIYYQQGLETNDVLTLTNETLKLAKVSGLDYATTTDYMTTALRGFKMEMSEASTVVDVYSNLAAHTAVSSEELAVAMSKTASSMESVGSTFEETSAMIGTMVAVTRESAVNIGSALKSIAARYGEMKKDPLSIIDSEGEEVSFNKVDAALQSVGISLKTADGQFRSFTEVIIELSEKWDQLESTQQRYIATLFAGNRQQSRFLALVSNKDLLKANIGFAEESEDTGTLQALKALDSIESKLNLVQVAYQQFYTTMGVETAWKGFLDGAKNVINTLNSLPKLFGKFPAAALGAIAGVINIVKDLGVKIITTFAQTLGSGFLNGLTSAQSSAKTGAENIFATIVNTIRSKLGQATSVGEETGRALATGAQAGAQSANKPGATLLTGINKEIYDKNVSDINAYLKGKSGFTVTDPSDIANAYSILGNQLHNTGQLADYAWKALLLNPANAKLILDDYYNSLSRTNEKLLESGQVAEVASNKFLSFVKNHGKGISNFGQAISMAGLLINTTTRSGKALSGGLMGIGGAFNLAGIAALAFNNTLTSIPWMAIVSGIFSVVNGISLLVAATSEEAELEELTAKAEELSNKAKEAKAEYRTLDTSINKLNELREKRYESIEATQEYLDAVDDLANKFPQMISGFDEAGNIILDTTGAEEALANARRKTLEATFASAKLELELNKKKREEAKNKYSKTISDLSWETETNGAYNTSISEQLRYNYLYSTLQEFTTKNSETDSAIRSIYSELIGSSASTFSLDEYNNFSNKINEAINQEIELLNNEILKLGKNKRGKDLVRARIALLQELLTSLSNYVPEITNEMLTDAETEMNYIKEQLADKFKRLNAKDFNINSQEANDLIKEINSLLIRAGGADSDDEFIQSITTTFRELLNEIGDYIDIDEIYRGNKRLVISSWLLEVGEWSFLEESSLGIAILVKTIEQTLEGKEFSEADVESQQKWKDKADEFLRFWRTLSKDRQELFNKMVSDTENYSYDDIIQEFSTAPEELIYNYYILSLKDRLIRLREYLGKISNNPYDTNKNEFKSSFVNEFFNEFYNITNENLTETEALYLNNILTQYKTLSSSGYNIRAQEFGNSSLELFSEIISLDSETKADLWKSIDENSLLTIEGLEAIEEAIDDSDASSEAKTKSKILIQSLKNNIIPKIGLTILSAYSSLLEDGEDLTKELSEAFSTGVTLKKADELVNKAKSLGLEDFNLDKFQLVGDKLILSELAFNDYYSALEKLNTLLIDDLSKNITSASSALKFLSTNGQSGVESKNIESLRTVLESIGFTDWDNAAYWASWGTLTEEAQKRIQELIESADNLLQEYSRAVQIIADQRMNATDRRLGIYKRHALDAAALNKQELKSIASNLHINKDNILDASIKKSLNEAYNSLVSDVFSKELSNINLADYEGLIKDDLTQEQLQKYANLKDGYSQFVRDYVGFTGKTVDEINDLMVLAYKKDSEKTSGAAKDALKDVTFYKKGLAYASLDTINELAKIFDIPVQNIIGQYNELLGGYLVNLNNINLSSIDGFVEMVKESIDGIIKNIVGFASSAISGKLSLQDQLNFNAQLKALGLSAIDDIDFTKTVDGLKISQTAAINLYNELRNIDGILAKLVFDDLNKSLQESNEHYKSISDITSHIVSLREKINSADEKISKERIALYKQELALAEEILAVRSTSEDSGFSFMSNKIPGAQNNPINYFTDWAKAIHTFNDALKTQGTYTHEGKTVKSGFVDYDFWYNLVTEMNNIAGKSGKEIMFAGERLNGDLKAAAALIEKGASSLVATDTGEIKVALSGMALNFETGADAFSGGVTEGIKELAKSQSEMLDGMIKVLETIVAMEGLEDLGGESGDANTIEISDILPNITWDTDGKALTVPEEFNKKYSDWTQSIIKLITGNKETNKEFNESLANAMNSIKIDGSSLASIITWDTSKLASMGQEFNESYAAFLNTMVQAAASNNYDLDNIWSSVKDTLAASGLTDITIDVGDITYGLSYGVLVEKTATGYKSSSGDEYPTMQQAALATLLEDKNIENLTVDADGKVTGTVKYDLTKFTIEIDKNGKTIWKDKTGKTYSSEALAAAKAYEEYKGHADNAPIIPETYSEWSMRVFGRLVLGEVVVENEDAFKTRTHELVTELAEALATDSTKDIVAKAKAIGINVSVNGELTEEQRKQIAELAGIEDKIVTISVKENAQDAEKNADNLIKKINELDALSPEIDVSVIDNTETGINAVLESLKSIPSSKNIDITTSGGADEATGNAGASGNALARGTLMGELGPELVVSKGRYFVVGQAGPEMVNLADDAIVFNHLQTESLLKKGMSKGRGKAVTNERNAVSFATGNVNGGPAKASASAMLGALRQLKAQWDALAGLSAKDLAGKGGGGGGGGGGDPKAFVKDLERWYDWLQQIAQLEKEITLEEAKRAKYQSDMVARGKEYFTSQMASLEKLQEQAVVLQSLNDSLEEYFLKRLKELNEQSAFSALYGFSESGQLYYKDVYADNKSAFEWLSDLVGRNEVTGEANYTAEELYNKLVEAGFGFAMQYDSAGNEIKQEGEDWYNTALQAFWDKIDRDKEEMQSLHDSVEDGKKKLYELETAQNEILHEIEDNLIAVEQKVLKAIEEARLREIDELKDTKEAIENSAKEFTDGLNKQLDKERRMRDNLADADELASLLRRLSILQRSGGSASEIRDLLQLINDKQYDKYFDMQEQLIQAIQDSSDAQIERLDNQILLMEETLAYEKENGLLWVDVDDILKQSSEDIVSFILGNTSEYWSKSTTELLKVLREDLFEVDRFKQFLETVEEGMDALIEKYGTEELKKALADKKRAEAAVADAAQEAAKATDSGVTNSGGRTTKPTNNPAPTTEVKKAIKTSTAELLTGKLNPTNEEILALGKGPLNTKKNITLDYENKAFVLPSGLTIKDENLFGSDPKAALNTSLIKTLKDLILTPKDSVKSLVASYNDAYKGLSSSTLNSIQNNSNATTIERAEVNINVAKLADDYDTKLLAKTFEEAVLGINSKTAAFNRITK